MSITITDRNGVLDGSSRDLVERRLKFALARFGSKIGKIAVNLCDENGPRGGVDKMCRIVVKVHRARDVVIIDRDADIKISISRAAERVGRAVARSIERTQVFNRSAGFDLNLRLVP